jgi:hypothetical protein
MPSFKKRLAFGFRRALRRVLSLAESVGQGQLPFHQNIKGLVYNFRSVPAHFFLKFLHRLDMINIVINRSSGVSVDVVGCGCAALGTDTD